MKVKELISKMVDSYVEIAVNEYKGTEHTGRRWIFYPKEIDYKKLPRDMWDKEVIGIVPYLARVSIEVNAETPDENTPVERPVWKNRRIIGSVDISLKDKDFLNEKAEGCFYIGFTDKEMKESF